MLQIDLFCRVIDNYGDIGVCWRLARQLVAEHGCTVRLIIDDLNAFRVIAPEINPTADHQSALGVEVFKWSAADNLAPGEVVIEAFACDPPPPYVEAMAVCRPKPVWLNLEYLSAEAWVDDIHGMPSQHQRLPLMKYFFCPGFTVASGGLIRERTIAPENSFAVNWLGAKTSTARLLAFTYPHAPVRALTLAFARSNLLAEVTLAAPIEDTEPGWLTAQPVPQTGFDALLAQYDFLIVRGEDSFVRAQWAAKPFLWHIYATDDGAHLIKLDAWLDRYCVGLEASVDAAYRAASRAFNNAPNDATQIEPYAALATHLPALAEYAVVWRDTLMRQTDLATRLLKFIAAQKSP